MKYLLFVTALITALNANAQKPETKFINQNIIVEDSIVGSVDSLVYQTVDLAVLHITLFEKVTTNQLLKLKTHYQELYSCSIKGKITYDLKLTNGIDISVGNNEYFQNAGAHLQKAARISNSSIAILVVGSAVGGGLSVVNPVAGGVVIIATGIVTLIQNIRANKFLRLAGEEIAKAS